MPSSSVRSLIAMGAPGLDFETWDRRIAGAPGPSLLRIAERASTLNTGLVTGHDFSRAEKFAQNPGALAPDGMKFLGAPGPSLLGTGEGNPDGGAR